MCVKKRLEHKIQKDLKKFIKVSQNYYKGGE